MPFQDRFRRSASAFERRLDKHVPRANERLHHSIDRHIPQLQRSLHRAVDIVLPNTANQKPSSTPPPPPPPPPPLSHTAQSPTHSATHSVIHSPPPSHPPSVHSVHSVPVHHASPSAPSHHSLPPHGPKGTPSDTLIHHVNARRIRCSLPALKHNAALARAAARHAEDLARNHGHLRHRGSDGSSPMDRVEREGGKMKRVWQMTAMGYDDAAKVAKVWKVDVGTGGGGGHAGAYWVLVVGVPK